MAKSLISSAKSVVTVTIKVGGSQVQVPSLISVYVNKEVNKIPYAEIVISDGGVSEYTPFEESEKTAFAPGSEVEILAGYKSVEKSIFKGIIIKHSLRLKVSQKPQTELVVECRDEAVKMTVGRKTEVFTEKKDSEIISQIIGTYSNLKKDIEATETKYAEMVQYDTTDWDYLMTRAEKNGMLVIVNDGKVSVKKPKLGAPKIEVVYGQSMSRFHGEIDARTQLSKVQSFGWDAATHALVTGNAQPFSDDSQIAGNLTKSKLASVVGLSSYKLQNPIQATVKMLQDEASSKMMRSSLSRIRGKVAFLGTDEVLPGDVIELKGLSKRFNGKVFCGGVEHTIQSGEWKTEVLMGLSAEMKIEPKDMDEQPHMRGLHIGIVMQVHEDKEGQHRIKVKIPILQKDNIGLWARLGSFYASNQFGCFFLPEVNDEVIVGFLNDDAQNPVILGSLYSKKNAPPLTAEKENNKKQIITRSKISITFDDKDKILEITTPEKNTITLDDKEGKITIVDKNKNQIEMSKDGVKMDIAKDLTIKAKGNIAVEAGGNIEMKATGNITNKGVNIENKASAKFAAEGSAQTEIKSGGQLAVKGSIVQIN
ncbi:MAG: hypothetical protein OHK0057_27440 [Thermoflexibacter sp.]